MRSLEDTIAALATPPGEGGIAIVRVSGPAAASLITALLRRRDGEGIGRPDPRRAVLGRVVHPRDGTPIDEVLFLWMPAPDSYTREDVLEIHCHGGRAAASAVLEACLLLGARLADPGEFTLRAFLRGRIDLVQAEAVADLIRADTEGALRVHETLLEGGLSREVAQWQEALGNVLVHLEACLDFPEEELETADRGELAKMLECVSGAMGRKLDSFAWGRTAREGFRVAILGAPNVGKSRLLNRLAEEEHAIVSPHAGTTRDAIEVRVNALGVPVRVIDTAGLRRAGDPVEEEGVQRARRAAAAADLVLFVFDGQRELDSSEIDEALGLAREKGEGGAVLSVMNKMDAGRVPEEALRELFEGDPVMVSAATGEGIEELLRRIRDHAWSGRGVRGEGPLTRLRHREAVAAARECVENARSLIVAGTALDATASELQGARRHLNGLLGWGTPEEVLDRIFSEFCIGK